MTGRTNGTNGGNNISSVIYNHLNLPRTIVATAGTTTYTYDATGRKLQSVFGSRATDYIDGIEYEDGDLNFIHMEEGRIVKSGSSYSYEYLLRDHLGNTRSGFRGDNPSVASIKSDYYPFGLQYQSGIVAGSPNNKYLYNGKELQDGTKLYDYGARLYDPIIGRWGAVDPLAESYYSSTPFNYVDNNPVRRIDPDGKSWSDWDDMWANNFGGMGNSLDNWMSTEKDPFYFEDSFETGFGDQDDPKKKRSVDNKKEINWKTVSKGAAGVTGGIVATGAGIGAIWSGVGAGVGFSAVTFGIPTIGFGFANLIEGFRGGEKIIPAGLLEATEIGFGGDGRYGEIADIFTSGLPRNLPSGVIMGYGIQQSKIGQSIFVRKGFGVEGLSLGYEPLIKRDNTNVVTSIKRVND